MPSIWVIVITVCGIVAIEAPSLIKKKLWRELAVFSVLTFTGFALSIANALHVPLPSPIIAINTWFTPIGKWLTVILE